MSPDSAVSADEKVAALLRRIERGDADVVSPIDLGQLGPLLTSDSRAAQAVARHAYRAPADIFIAWSERIWRYSLARGIAMRLLAERAQASAPLSPGVAYAAGLLADVGATYLLRWWSTGVFEAAPLSAEALERIEASVRSHHEAAGAALLARWGLDPLTVHLARNHHTERPSHENPYWVLGVVADMLAKNAAADPDLTYTAPLSAAVREGCCQTARVSPAELRRLAVRVRLEFQDAQSPLAPPPGDHDRLLLWLGGPSLATADKG